MKTRVLSHCDSHANQMASEEGLPPDSFRIVTTAADLKGYRGIVFVSHTVEQRKDYPELKAALEANKCNVITSLPLVSFQET